MAKYTKFGIKKYINEIDNVEDYKSLNIIKDKENNLDVINKSYLNILNECSKNNNTNIENWLINSFNSCRYDVFITLYGFCIKDVLYNIKYKFNDIFNTLNITFETLIDDPLNNAKFVLWEYFSKNNIDPIDYLIYNTKTNNNIINIGIGHEGYLAQLFKIFKNDPIFCIKEKKHIVCTFCQYKYEIEINNLNQFILITKDNLNFINIEDAIASKQNVLSREYCPNCQKDEIDKLYPKCKVQYCIDNFPVFLFILFDMDYNDLLENKEKIKIFSNCFIKFTNNIKYEFKGIGIAENINHFTTYIHNYQGSINKFGLNKGLNYFHDGCANNGCFVQIEENLNNFIDIHIPYINIYKKF